jgi:hypothetical protein
VKHIYRDLVVRQEKQLVKLFRETGAALGDIDIDVSSTDAAAASAKRALAGVFGIDSIFQVLEGDAINTFFAILLTPDGVEPKAKDLKAIAEAFEDSLTLTTQSAVLASFFAVGRGAIDRILAGLKQGKKPGKRPASG